MARIVVPLLFMIGAASCRHRPALTSPELVPSSVARFELAGAHAEIEGVSDLVRAGDLYYAVQEQKRALVEIRVDENGRPLGWKQVPLDGIEHLDTESIAWLGGTKFAIGTESGGDRANDDILFIDVQEGRARVTGRVAVAWSAWGAGVHADDNHGIEALCAIDGELYAAGELVMKEGGARIAPVARIDIEKGVIAAWRLRLTTDKGKIAALTCRRAADGSVEALAVERHYGIGRILRFNLPGGDIAAASPIVPVVAADLAPRLDPLPNIEGIAPLGDQLLLVTDNKTAIITGPTELLRLSLPPPKP